METGQNNQLIGQHGIVGVILVLLNITVAVYSIINHDWLLLTCCFAWGFHVAEGLAIGFWSGEESVRRDLQKMLAKAKEAQMYGILATELRTVKLNPGEEIEPGDMLVLNDDGTVSKHE